MPTLHADKFFYLSNDLFCVEGTDGYFKVVNPAFRKVLGYTEDVLLSNPIISFVHPEDADPTLLDSRLIERTVKPIENRLRCANGEYRWFSWSRSLGADGALILASARDITREKKLERKLEIAVAENQMILDSTLDMICTFDREGNFISASKACESLLGYSQEELRGRSYMEFVDSQDFLKSTEARVLVQDGFHVTNFENQYKRKDGSLVPLSWSARWSSDDQTMYSIARDARQKRQEEDLMLLSEKRLRALVHSGSDLISIISKDGIYNYVSPSVELLGYSGNFLIGKSTFDYIHPDDIPQIEQAFQDILDHDRVEVPPFRFKDATGHYRWIKTIATNRINDPAILGIVTNSRDVTESLKLENEREQASARVHNLINNFTEGYILVNRDYMVVDYNQKANEIIGRNIIVAGNSLWDIFPEAQIRLFYTEYERAFNENVNVRLADYYPPFQRWYEVSAYPYQSNLTIFFKDITEVKIKELNLSLEKDVLEMNTDSVYSLQQILDHYLAELSLIYPEQRLAVSLVDKKGTTLTPISSPAVPQFCKLFSAGFPVAPIEGTCCDAAYQKKISGFPDLNAVEIDPLFKQFVINSAIRAVWSFPITNENDKVLATVAAFYSVPKTLSEAEEEVIRRIITFIQILIESHQTRDFLEMNIERYKLVTQSAKDAIYDWDIANDELFWGEGMEKAFGYRNPTTTLHWWEERVHMEDLPNVNEALIEFLADPAQSCWHANYRFLRSDGTYAYVLEDGFVIRNSKGKALRMVGAMQDHTTVIENQLHILKQNNVLREIARINSHYIRKPLANILALIATIKDCEVDELKELIDMLELSGNELDEITRQIARKAYS